jgi:hypothetical protein
MRFINSLMILSAFCGEYYELFEMFLSQSYRVGEKNYYDTIMKSNFPRTSPLPYSDLSKNYLAKKYQDRHNYNRPTKMPFNGLQKKANRGFRESKIIMKDYKEQKIKEAFARKIKNKTHQKRHHPHSW